ncbi:MAG TPA: ATPase domain-containing protein [Steroidobacteraceae bacterium]|jgi:circadian clock protein KaiC|nr:ATPase domain-containing protein [Steroidobacteraceae bacterium]
MPKNKKRPVDRSFAATGVAGLDTILNGGLARGRTFLLEGSPGTGKTTIALQYLMAGAALGELGLCVTMSETADELKAGAASHGWSLEGIRVFELAPPENLLTEEQQQSLLYSSDLELGETTQRIFGAFEALKPVRVVLDSLSEIRLLAQGSLRYRRQILALKHFFATRETTVLMLDDLTTDERDKTVHSVAHGVIRLEELAPEFGSDRRRLRVLKYRGNAFRGGFHDFLIETGGVRVFPRLVASEHHHNFARSTLNTGHKPFDKLLGGGVERGSSVLVLGPAGAGKSIIALTFLASAVRRGERVAMFVFDEELGLLLDRAKGLGFGLEAMRRKGQLRIMQIDAAELTPGEFSMRVRESIEAFGAKTVIIDSINGYQAAMPEEHALVLHMHELLQFCNRSGVTTFVTVAQHGLVGGDMKAPIDLTYLADTVILLRYFEMSGEVRRAVSVVKKRTSAHENTIREYRLTNHGIVVGPPLTNLHGVLRGVPTMVGGNSPGEDGRR